VADLLRIAKGTGAQPRGIFQGDAGLVDIDSGMPAVALTRPDGTAGPAPGTVTRVSLGTYTFTLGQQTEPTLYTVTWTGPVGGATTTITTYVEVVGSHLFTLAEARAYVLAGKTPLAATPQADLLSVRDEVTDDFADRGPVAVARFVRETHDGDNGAALPLREGLPLKVLSVTIDGVAQALTGDFFLRPGAVLERKRGGWFPATQPQNITVEYVHGYPRVPPAVRRAALIRTVSILNPSLAALTVSGWTAPDGTTYSYDRTGQARGGYVNHYSNPAVDGPLNWYGRSASVLGFA